MIEHGEAETENLGECPSFATYNNCVIFRKLLTLSQASVFSGEDDIAFIL